MQLKEGIRILALAGAPFRSESANELIIGVIGRKGVVEGAVSFHVEVDGLDSASSLIKTIKVSRFRSQIKLIALAGVTFAGMNIINIEEVEKKLGIPVLAVTRRKPHKGLMRNALKYSKHREEKLKLFSRLCSVLEIKRESGYYLQYTSGRGEVKGFTAEAAELLRLSHIIASSLGSGESKGRI